MDTRKCPQCGVYKPLSEWSKIKQLQKVAGLDTLHPVLFVYMQEMHLDL